MNQFIYIKINQYLVNLSIYLSTFLFIYLSICVPVVHLVQDPEQYFYPQPLPRLHNTTLIYNPYHPLILSHTKSNDFPHIQCSKIKKVKKKKNGQNILKSKAFTKSDRQL